MRNTLFSSLLISSFLLSSLPLARGQEVLLPEPTEPVVTHAVEAITLENTTEELLVAEPVLTIQSEEVVADEETMPSLMPTDEPLESLATTTPEEVTLPNEVATSSEPLPAVERTALLTVRYGENVAWSGTVTLPTPGSTTTAASTDGQATVEIAADSLLAVLMQIDATSDAFSITDLDYYPSFDSFIVNCISAATFTEACSQWQYVIDGTYPFVGIDDYLLESDDQIFIYFGSPRRVVLPTAPIVINETFVATAQAYDPASNTYGALSSYTIGITQPDPANPWSPREIVTATSGADGTAAFTLSLAGAYDIGLQEDFYYPSTPFTVSSTTATSTGPGTGNGSGGTTSLFDVPAAFSFLANSQNGDGSWDTEFVTDWIALALATPGAPSSAKSALANYLRNEEPGLDSSLDYARQAMALMALGINPYTGGKLDMITPIIESFDGEQIDETSLVNDDIFALVALMNAGYDEGDEIIRASAAFVVAEQRGDGSWVNSPSITAAGIQALTPIRSLPGVSGALNRAESYLRSAQRNDGGFGDQSVSDAFATSWVLQAIEALGSTPSDWKKGDASPLTYLANVQEDDGGMKTTPSDTSTREWATAYAIPAVKGLTWHDILRDFKKPAGTESPSTGKGSDTETATTTSETEIATSTDTVLVDPTPTLLDVPEVIAAQTEQAVTMNTEVAVGSSDDSAMQEVIAAEADNENVETATATSPLLTASALDSAGGQTLWAGIKTFFATLWQVFTSIF